MAFVIQNNDVAIGHTDILGNQITGIITTASKLKIMGIDVGLDGDIVFFPSHPHQIVLGVPTNYQTHSIPCVGTGKLRVSSKKVALDGDLVPVADIAGGDAFLQSSQTKLTSV